jgi:Immunity protein Imm5
MIEEKNRIIQDAINLVNNHPQHHLELQYRQKLWKIFYKDCINYQKIDELKMQRYFIIKQTVMHIQFIWNEALFDRGILDDIVKLLDSYIEKKISIEEALEEQKKIWELLLNMFSDDEYQTDYYQRAISTAMSAYKGLEIIFFDNVPDVINNRENYSDEDIEMHENDSAYWAATAYAGPEWDLKSSDKIKRLEFWKWWLEEVLLKVISSKDD